jgi:hypothetical protein
VLRGADGKYRVDTRVGPVRQLDAVEYALVGGEQHCLNLPQQIHPVP